MKLLIISDAWLPQVNGVVRTYEHLGTELRKMGHTVKVVGPANFRIKIPLPGYPEIKLAIAPYKRLKRIIEEYQPDKIHIPTEGPLGWAARKYCLKHNTPFSTSFHTLFPDYIAKRVAKIIPFAYGVVHEQAKSFIRTFHAPSKVMMVATQSLENTIKSWQFKNPTHRVTRGADLEQFKPGESDIYNGIKAPIALYVGRIAIEKSIEDFLEMKWKGSKVLIGDGPSLNMLKKKYPEAHFKGNKTGKDLAEFYRGADLFVFPSRTDTFGMVIVEALASGVPVAAYNVTGPKDIITEPFLGALHDTDLEKAAHEALKNGNAQQRADYVKKHYTWKHAAQQYEYALINKVKRA